MIFVDPNELKSDIATSYDLGLKVKPCPGLEELTGADFAVSQIPIPVAEATLDAHIKARTFFVQRKLGYDVLSWDALMNAIARMQKCKIPQPQAVLLIIGNFWEDDQGYLRYGDWSHFSETKWTAFQKLQARWTTRGGVVHRINSNEQLQNWVEVQLDVMSGEDRQIYPTRVKPVFEKEFVWEAVEEIPPNDVRYFLCAGMYGFGPKLANTITKYILEHISHLDGYGLYYLKVLTDVNPDGKPVHEIEGWGIKKRETLRDMLGLADGYNLTVQDVTDEVGRQFANAWYGALRTFRDLVEDGVEPGKAWALLISQANEMFKEEGVQ